MANLAQYMTAGTLNFWFTPAAAATVTRPTAWGVGLSLGSPTSVSGSEITLGSSNYSRQTAGGATPFSTAATPSGSATVTNNSNITFGPLSAGSYSGVQIWDTVLSNNSGNMIVEGLLTTARTLNGGDQLIIASGALTVSLN